MQFAWWVRYYDRLSTGILSRQSFGSMVQVILSDAIVKLSPRFFWLGGGEVDLKLGMQTDDFIRIVKPFITDCLY